MSRDFSHRITVSKVPSIRRGCNNTTFPLEPQDAAIVIGESVYLQPSEVTELQHLLERIDVIGLDEIDRRRGKRLDEATDVKSFAVCKARLQKDDPEHCTVCGTQLATRPNAITLKQHQVNVTPAHSS